MRYYSLAMDDFADWVKSITQSEAARRFGVSQKAVSKWVNGQIPLARVRQIESETGIPASRLRPDVFDSEQSAA